jgi:hypothetical protein
MQNSAVAPRAGRLSWPGWGPSSRHGLGEMEIPISPFIIGIVGDPRVVLAAFDLGINTFFVSADMHWMLYEHLRRGLMSLFARGSHVRDQVRILAVSYVAQPEFSTEPFREVIGAIPGLGYLDATVIGGAYPDDFRARIPAYRAHRDGFFPCVRATAATFHDRTACAHALSEQLIDLAFVRYNPSRHSANVMALRDLCGPTQLLYNFNSTRMMVTRERFAELGLHGAWYPEPPDYYRFALTTGAFDGILCSFRNEKELLASVAGVGTGALSQEQFRFMSVLSDVVNDRVDPRALRALRV